ncbi:MAG: Glu/Leu/Phe/Val dehydrogenase [Candidatus Micrarchaeota archaeon]
MLSAPSVIQDEFGPQQLLDVYDAKTGMEGVLVIDNTALGPGKGGIRLVHDVTVEEVCRLARAMTWKNALAGLPFGGAKAGIRADHSKPGKAMLVKAFADKIRAFIPKYFVAGPDMNTTEDEMAAFAEEVGSPRSCTGKPLALGGLPHELGSTGFGVFVAASAALRHGGLSLQGASVAIEGFGNVGVFSAHYLSRAGARIVAVSDSKGAAYDARGLDVSKLEEFKRRKGSVTAYPGAKAIPKDGLFGLPVDVLIPGARPDSIHDGNKRAVKARVIVEAANVPISEKIELEFHERGVLVVPDIVANAGGVISSYVETRGGTPESMFRKVDATISANTERVLELAESNGVAPRSAALGLAVSRVRSAMRGRRG